MRTTTYEKMVCTSCNEINSNLMTPGKVYEVKTEEETVYGEVLFLTKSFIADDGKAYLIDYQEAYFMRIGEWREQQLLSLLDNLTK